MKHLMPFLAAMSIVVIVISAAAKPTPKKEAKGLPASKEVGTSCYFPQAPATIEDGKMLLFACQQIYNEEPTQCCLYVSAKHCAMLCNMPLGAEPVMFRGSAVPCPGEEYPEDSPVQEL